MPEKDNMNVFPNIYENRYPVEFKITPDKRMAEDLRKAYLDASIRNIKYAQKTSMPLKQMGYFYNSFLNQEARAEELRRFKASGGKVVGVFCIHVPDELIYAAGAVPIQLSCGLYDSITLGEEVLPKNICPMIKSSVGFGLGGVNPFFDLCDVLIIPASCDGKKKMIDVLSQSRAVWPLELPCEKESESGKRTWAEQVRKLKENLERLTGKRISRDTLKQAILVSQKRTMLSRRLMEHRRSDALSISGTNCTMIMAASFFDDIFRWMNNLEALLSEIENSPAGAKGESNGARVMITGSPVIWPGMKIYNIIEGLGARVVCDDSCSGGQYYYNPPVADEWTMQAMIDSVTDKSLLPVVCPVFIQNDDRIDRILELREQCKVDGIIYHVVRLCAPFDFEYKKVAAVAGAKGIPILRLETEYGDEDAEQLRTRVEAFLEVIGSKG